MRNIRGVVEDFRARLTEDQALVAVLGAAVGVGLAIAGERFGPEPDPNSFAITVEQARGSLLNALALVFTGLSIVLALTALTTQNMASKFSPRLLRMKLRGSGNKLVLGVFAVTAAFERPPAAADLVEAADGYVGAVDTGRMTDLATAHGTCVVIAAGIGCPVVRGERVGWMAPATSEVGAGDLDDMVDCVTVGSTRDPGRDVGYTISVLVDVALMALSPAVNDPRTAVECVEMLTEVVTELFRRDLGTHTRLGPDGSPVVAALDDCVGDYVDAAGRQMLLYGGEDRPVTSALLRLAREAERTARTDRDRRLALALAEDVAAVRVAGAGSQGRLW